MRGPALPTLAAKLARRPVAPFILAGLGIVAALAIWHQGRGLTFYYDEWEFVINRRGGGLDTYLEPHVDHLYLGLVALFKLLFATAGLDHYGWYRAAAIASHLLCVGLVFVVVRRRVGDALALAATAPLLFLGSAWQDLLSPFQISFTASTAAFAGILLALDRHDRRGDGIVMLLLLVALAFSSLGVAILVGVALEILWGGDRRRRIWVVAIPLALYAAWYIGYGTGPARRGNIPDLPAYIADSAAAAVGGLSGLGERWAPPLAVLAGALLVWRLAGGRPVSARLAMLVTVALANWAFTGLARAQLHDPAAVRYVYFGAVIVVLIAAEACRDLRPGPRAIAAVAVLAAAATLANVDALRDGARRLHRFTDYVAPELGAIEIVGPAADPGFRPDPVRAPDVVAGPYLEAVASLGSPADTPAEIARRPAGARAAADGVLLGAQHAALAPAERPAGGGAPPRLLGAPEGRVAASGRCLRFAPAAAGGAAIVSLPASGLTVTAARPGAAEVFARRFGDSFSATPVGRVADGSTGRLRLLGGPWTVRVTATGPAELCSG